MYLFNLVNYFLIACNKGQQRHICVKVQIAEIKRFWTYHLCINVTILCKMYVYPIYHIPRCKKHSSPNIAVTFLTNYNKLIVTKNESYLFRLSFQTSEFVFIVNVYTYRKNNYNVLLQRHCLVFYDIQRKFNIFYR